MLIFIKNRTGTVDATAEYDPKSGNVTVKKGSLVAKELSTAPTFRSRNSMLKKREGTVVDGIMVKDMEFGSLSTSATFVVGSNRDGWITWRDADGKTMADLFGGANDY
jgi:hypothetical protein